MSMLPFYRCLHFLYWHLLAAENQAKSWLHEKAARYHNQHEGYPGGLASGGWRRVQASKRDSLSGCKLHWPLPLLHVGPEGEASASWYRCHAAGLVCVHLLFKINFQTSLPSCRVTPHCICRKFEEIYPPEVAEFVYITDDTYTKKQVLRMEHLVLKVLSFDLAAPTINQFLTQYFLHQSVGKQVENLAMVSSVMLHLQAVIKSSCKTLHVYIWLSVSWGTQSGWLGSLPEVPAISDSCCSLHPGKQHSDRRLMGEFIVGFGKCVKFLLDIKVV